MANQRQSRGSARSPGLHHFLAKSVAWSPDSICNRAAMLALKLCDVVRFVLPSVVAPATRVVVSGVVRVKCVYYSYAWPYSPAAVVRC